MGLPMKRSLNSASARHPANKAAQWAYCLAAHRAFGHCTFNVRNLPGQARAHQSIAGFRDHDHVLDAHADAFFRDVDSRLDSNNVTGFERAILAEIMHVEPDRMAESVNEVLGVFAVLLH